MEMLRKVIDCGSLNISQEHFYGGVSFSKVTSLQCLGCNFAMNRTHYRFFLEYVTNTSCLKKYFE